MAKDVVGSFARHVKYFSPLRFDFVGRIEVCLQQLKAAGKVDDFEVTPFAGKLTYREKDCIRYYLGDVTLVAGGERIVVKVHESSPRDL